MATQRISSSFSSPTVTFYLDADVVDTEPAPAGAGYGRWKIRMYLRMSKPSGSFYGGAGTQYGRGNGVNRATYSDGSSFLPSGTTSWNKGPYDFWVNANSEGYWSGTSTTYPLQMRLDYGSIDNTKSGSITLSRLATKPPAPSPIGLDQITTTSMRYRFSSNGTGGATFLRWEFQYSTSPTFASGNSGLITSSGSSTVTGLVPNVRYYFRSRGVNSLGNGAWSTTSNALTLSADVPGMLVSPQPSGRSAQVALTPPPNLPYPTGYRIQYTPAGGTAVTVDVTTSPYTVSGLTPGVTYGWRAAALSGSYVGPYTATSNHFQPQPSFNAGQYFDGSTTDTTDTDYQWLGTAGNSKSVAYGHPAKGWDAASKPDSLAVGVRVTGGNLSAFSVQYTFMTDATESGESMGVAFAGAAPILGGAYVGGLIHAAVSRPQRLAAMLTYYTAAGASMGTVLGPDVLVPGDGEMVELRVNDTASISGFVTISVVDVEGSGWSLWEAGDVVTLDSAILPFNDYYFDGSTTDTFQYNYVWAGTANDSASNRLESTIPAPDPLLDPDCPPVPAPPRPPAILDSCVEDDVVTWRQYWTEILWNDVPEWIDSVPIVHIEANNPVRLVRIRYYQNPNNLSIDEIPKDEYCNEQLISYIPSGVTLTLDGVSQRAWAQFSGSPGTFAADHLVYRGTDDVPVWPILGCSSGYYITIDVPEDSPVGSVEVRYEMVQKYS